MSRKKDFLIIGIFFLTAILTVYGVYVMTLMFPNYIFGNVALGLLVFASVNGLAVDQLDV